MWMNMRNILLTAFVLAMPRVALACPVCFGQSDSPLALGANMGIWAMLGFTGVVLSAFASFFIYLMRRARMVSQDQGRPDVAHDRREGIA